MAARFPVRPSGVELGVGLDLSWGQDPGLIRDPVRGDVVTDGVVSLLERQAAMSTHLSVSWQPRRRVHVEARDYLPAYDDLFARIGHLFATRALQHSAVSRRAVEAYRRGELLEVTNILVDRYHFGWVSEDVGLWPIQGKPPHPIGPRLNQEGLWVAIRHAKVVRAGLEVPLLVDFPGFATTAGAHEAPIHAYDFFCSVAEEADVAVAIDTAKLLAYQWQRNRRGDDLLGELDKLPLARCFEIHVSAREGKSGRIFEGTADVLSEAQMEMLKLLAPSCPNVRLITYDGPVLDGGVDAASVARSEFVLLREVVSSWSARAGRPPAEVQA
jgi:hypothetical protein